MPASLHAYGAVFPFVICTSICRNSVTICSGLYLCMGIPVPSYNEILSHFGWYKYRRAGQSDFNNKGASYNAPLSRVETASGGEHTFLA